MPTVTDLIGFLYVRVEIAQFYLSIANSDFDLWPERPHKFHRTVKPNCFAFNACKDIVADETVKHSSDFRFACPKTIAVAKSKVIAPHAISFILGLPRDRVSQIANGHH
jgi:hypothetical protein